MILPVKNGLLVVVFLIAAFSCRKESFTTNPEDRLSFSADTLHFDTVFTTTGSTSSVLKIINDNSKALHIDAIRLAGGSSSAFRINADGQAGPVVNGLEISGHDSAYVFVSVHIDPNTANLAFLVQDSLFIEYNGIKDQIQLDAFGQNARFLRDHLVLTDEEWTNELPYVILGKLEVAPGAKLSIQEGCKVYMHANAPFIINGSLQVNGDRYDSTRVYFSSDRLDAPYSAYPGGYPGLIFTSSSADNIINYAVIKNAYQGITVTDPAAGTKLILNETIIDNAYDAGILALNTSINARNLLITNCGKNLVIASGGRYQFTHCTLAAYSTDFIQHKDPILSISNSYMRNNIVSLHDLDAQFNNCIIWGESGGFVTNELLFTKLEGTGYKLHFQDILWNPSKEPGNSTISGVDIRNENPLFQTLNFSDHLYDFHLKDGSPALNRGGATTLSSDLDGNPRPVGLPDLGAYEKQ